MPAIVIICPKCQAKYQVPDTLLGKTIECKKCSTKFVAARTGQPVAAAASKPSPTPAKAASAVISGATAAELARFGLDGPITRAADPMASLSSPPPQDILGNFAADPGFVSNAMPNLPAGAPVPSGATLEFLQNPFAKKAKVSKEPEAIPSPDPEKNKKRERHPEVQESLNNATMTLAVIGVFILLVFGFFYMNAEHDVKAMAKNSGVPAEVLGSDETVMGMTSVLKVIYMFGMGLGLVFCGLGAGVQFFPITSIVLGMVLYVALELVLILMNPFSLLSMWRWIIRIGTFSVMIKALVDAFNARSYERMLKAKRKGR